MKHTVALITLLFCSFFLHAQDLTGIWRGYFSSGIGFYKQQYKYEVQINQLKNSSLQGVTYSYRSTVFYGKANLRGINMTKSGNIIIKEDTLLEVKVAGASEPCLMTCYLEYYKVDNTEVLEGSFTSVNIGNKGDCGSGNVYLERVTESDFEKEDFLVKKEQEKEKKKQTPLVKKAPTVKKTVPQTTPPVAKKTTPQTSKPLAKAKPKPPVKSTQPKRDTTVKQPPVITRVQPETPEPQQPQIKQKPVPKIVQERETRLVKTIITSSPEIRIDLYDNGEIDGDTITVYHNNDVMVYKKRLSSEPITLNITASVDDATHEFIMFADNLGKIPPNTALMVVTTGGKRYEVFMSADEQKNAKVVIQFKVPGTDSK